MKLKSYKLLFRIFSFLSDKTNGASFFVKYKLLLGTLIIALAGSSASGKSQKQAVCYDMAVEPDTVRTTCYDTIVIKAEQALPAEREITGTIKDQSGAPLMATILIKDIENINNGVLSGADGKFKLKVKQEDIILQVSCIGYHLLEIEIPASKFEDNINIVMTEDALPKAKVLPPIETTVITCYIIMPDDAILNNTEQEITGTITDQSGNPVMATILVKNTNIGILSDKDGKFKLKAKPKDVLKISSIGYYPLDVPVSDFKDNMTIVMEEEPVLCYDPVEVPIYNDPIYMRTPRRITKLPYNEIHQRPVPPQEDLDIFREWLEDNIVYNEQMYKDKTEGVVILSFAIDKKGEVVDKKVLAKLSPDADKEALRVLSLSDKWQPGIHDGKAIKTTMTISVTFKLKK